LSYGFHSFLNDYILKNKVRKILEIGIADSENAKTMILVASKNFPVENIEYYGFDIFGGDSDSHFKRVQQKLVVTGCHVSLFKGDSTVTLPKFIENYRFLHLVFHIYTQFLVKASLF